MSTITLVSTDLEDLQETEFDIMTQLSEEGEPISKHKKMFATITITNHTVDTYIDKLLNDDILCVIGIHTVIVIPSVPHPDRVRIEYAALCYLSRQAGKYLKKYPEISDEERTCTSESIVTIVSRAAFRIFQCMYLGILQYRRFKTRYREHNNQVDMSVHDIVVINESLGEICWPTSKDFDEMFRLTRWTTDVFEPYRLNHPGKKRDKDHIHLTYKNFRMPPYFYVQMVEKWQ